jgi:alpha-beta hydrolase superfamily lysophospholipase
VAATTLTTVDGIRLAGYLHCVAAPRGSVVVAHGFTASATHADVEALAGALGTAGYDVVTYDARGHGDSEGQCTLGDLERHDVAAAVQATNPASGPVVLVGLSMGAIAVLRHAAEQSTAGVRPAVGVVTVSAPARWKLPRNARGVLSAGITSTPPGRAFAARRLAGPRVGGGPRRRSTSSPNSTSRLPSSTASTTRSFRAATPEPSTTRRRSLAASTSCRARGMRTTMPRCR